MVSERKRTERKNTQLFLIVTNKFLKKEKFDVASVIVVSRSDAGFRNAKVMAFVSQTNSIDYHLQYR